MGVQPTYQAWHAVVPFVLELRGARMRKRAKEGRCEGRKPYGYYEGEAVALSTASRRG
jgi:hypothetical protein